MAKENASLVIFLNFIKMKRKESNVERSNGMLRSIANFLKPLKFNYFALFTIVLSTFILFGLMVGTVKQETYELKEFQVAPEVIRSLKTVEDVEKTEQERTRAANEVLPVYQFSDGIAGNRRAIADSVFDFFIDEKSALLEKTSNENPEVSEKSVVSVREKLKGLEEEEPSLQLTDAAIADLLAEDPNTLKAIKEEVGKEIVAELSKPIRATDVTFSKYDIERQLRVSYQIPDNVERSVITIARSMIVETETLNAELTELRREEARASVEPIRILQGQVLVREGQVIDSEVYRQLELAGLLTDQTEIKPMIAIGLFVIMMMAVIYMHFHHWREDAKVKKKSLAIVLVIYFFTVILMKLFTLLQPEFHFEIAFLFPTALASMLVKILVNDRTATMVSIVIAATAGILLQDGFASVIQIEMVLYILLGSLTSIYLIGNVAKRSTILRASIGVSMINLFFIGFYLLMTQATFELNEVLFYVIAAFVSGILSSALTIGLVPFFEMTFGILSDMRLIELSNPNHPLLKKILTETPGTYHHSVMVANLSDAACEAIGANGLLARVGSYYHDVGKTMRPRYFIENQHGERNPHDDLPPKRSKDIIIAHAEDGAKLLEKHKMPREIVDIARQHHGTSLLKFFVYKAKELGEDVNEEDYRYGGPKPRTKEVAVISIADSVEAAVRSMKEPTTEKISNLVQAIVADKLNDGQFDECDLSMKELRKIERTICESLNGMFHSRIEYPDEKE